MIVTYCLYHKLKQGKWDFDWFENRIFFSSGDTNEHQKQVVSVTGEASSVSHKRKRLRKPDTNVLSVKFNQLLQPGKFWWLNNQI